jgi:hypothetical protein
MSSYSSLLTTRSNTNSQHSISYINRMTTLPITKQAKQQEWKIIIEIGQNNGFPLHIIHNLKKKLTVKKQKLPTTTQAKKWATFSYHSPLLRKITNLFKHSNLNISLLATNTIYQQLTDKITKISTNSSGTYRLQCKTCNNSYVGQSG